MCNLWVAYVNICSELKLLNIFSNRVQLLINELLINKKSCSLLWTGTSRNQFVVISFHRAITIHHQCFQLLKIICFDVMFLTEFQVVYPVYFYSLACALAFKEQVLMPSLRYGAHSDLLVSFVWIWPHVRYEWEVIYCMALPWHIRRSLDSNHQSYFSRSYWEIRFTVIQANRFDRSSK